MSEVDEISTGLGKEMRGMFAAALAVAQLAAQRHAARVRDQAAATGEDVAEARRRFGAEQRMAALGITAPRAGMDPREVAAAWAKADVARAHAPEVAQAWDAHAREVGVDPEAVRDLWWRQQDGTHTRTEDPAAYRTALAGLGLQAAGAIADADRARAEHLEQGGRAEREDAQAADRNTVDADRDAARQTPGSEQAAEATAAAVTAEDHAGTHHERADTLEGRADDLRGHATQTERDAAPRTGTEHSDAGSGGSPAEPGAWQQGHPTARLVGRSYGVTPGRGQTAARNRRTRSGQGMGPARQREHGR